MSTPTAHTSTAHASASTGKPSPTRTSPASTSPAAPAVREGAPSPLQSDLGRTTVADTVVSQIAGLAAREVPGVHTLGGGAARALGAIRERIPGATTNAGQGVTVEVGERQTAVDLEVVVAYGVAIPDLAAAIRRNVITALEHMTGLQVVEVNVAVNDVHLPDNDNDTSSSQGPRVA